MPLQILQSFRSLLPPLLRAYPFQLVLEIEEGTGVRRNRGGVGLDFGCLDEGGRRSNLRGHVVDSF